MKTPRVGRLFRDLAEWALYPPFLLLSLFLASLPLGFALRLGRLFGDLGYYVIRFRRGVVLGNLRHVFGDRLEEAEIHALAREAYQEALMTLVELLRASRSTPENFEYHAEFENLEPLLEMQAGGQPAILCVPHAANFYLTGFVVGQRGLRFTTLVKRLNAPQYERVLDSARRRFGMEALSKQEASIRQLARLLKSGKWVAMLPDQNARKGGVVVDFLGRPAKTFRGPALLHFLTGAPIVIAVDTRCRKDPRQHHIRTIFIPPFERTEDRQADVVALTEIISDRMSEVILENPAQYLWFHRRWGREASRTGTRVGPGVPSQA